jgi:dipeptidyl aminopeptidase/acylaminoacyl peptidase
VNRRALLTRFAAAAFVPQNERRRLDRHNLLIYRDSAGSIREVRNTRDWVIRRDDIVRGMQQVMGSLPGHEKRCPLDMRIEEEIERASYVRRLISYATEPGGRVPAYLLVPKTVMMAGAQAPAVLCLHPTDNTIGHKVVVEQGSRANRQYAVELVERGYVALAPSYPLLANYQPDLRALGYQSGTIKAVWDNIRGLDLLETLPFVARGAFAAIGHSLGGHNSVYTAVFDTRIRAIVSSCGLDSFLDYKGGDIRGWTSDRYMPELLAYRKKLEDIPFDFSELIAALAPRACFISAPLRDDNFQWKSVARLAASARAIYRLHEKEENLVVHHPDCGHDFPPEVRQLAYEMLDKHLRQ